MIASFADLDRALAADLRPAKKSRSLTDFARALRLPDGPSGPRDGRPGDLWVPETEPTQIAFLHAVDSGRWRKFTIVAPSQRGKTLKAIVSTLLHATTDCRQSVGFVLPSLDKLSQAWDGKLKPAIEGTGFGAWLPTNGPGSRGGKPPVLTLRDPATDRRAGLIYFMAMGTGGRETQVSMVSPQKIMIDEADDAESSGKITLICKRINSWGKNGRAYIASTVNDRTGRDVTDRQNPDSSHPILMLFREGSGHRQHHRCQHCLGYFIPELEHLDVDQARITCPLCSVIWSESDRREAINNSLSAGKNDKISEGNVVSGYYESDDYSELTTVLDYHMTVLTDVCADIRAARLAESRGASSLMKTVVQKMFCRSYVEPELEGELNSETLAKFSSHSTSSKRLVPLWAEFLVITQDVQGDRHYWETVAHGPDERWAIIDWGYEFLVPKNTDGNERAPTKADRIRVLDAIRDIAEQGWQIEGGEGRMRPVQSGVDCGYLAEEVSAWVQGNPSWKAVRGVGFDELKDTGGGIEKTLPPEIRATKALRAVKPPGWRIYWWKVDGHVFRRSAHAALLRSPDQPGSGILPQGLKANSDLILHLTGEIWTEPEEGKTGKPFWREVRKRHDYLDCLVYNLALALLHRYAPDRRDSGDPAPVPAAPASVDSSWIESSFDQSPGGWING